MASDCDKPATKPLKSSIKKRLSVRNSLFGPTKYVSPELPIPTFSQLLLLVMTELILLRGICNANTATTSLPR